MERYLRLGCWNQRLTQAHHTKFSQREYFSLMKALRRIIAAVTVTLLAFRAVAVLFSWIEKQEDSEVDAWIDEDEFEEA